MVRYTELMTLCYVGQSLFSELQSSKIRLHHRNDMQMKLYANELVPSDGLLPCFTIKAIFPLACLIRLGFLPYFYWQFSSWLQWFAALLGC